MLAALIGMRRLIMEIHGLNTDSLHIDVMISAGLFDPVLVERIRNYGDREYWYWNTVLLLTDHISNCERCFKPHKSNSNPLPGAAEQVKQQRLPTTSIRDRRKSDNDDYGF